MNSSHTQRGERGGNRGDRGDRRGGSRRRSRGGGGGGGSQGRSYSPNRQDYKPAPKKPQTLWEKIVSFFTGGDKKPAKTASRPSSPTSGSTSRPAPEAPRNTKRKPEAVEVTSPKLYVGNLSYEATESDLVDLFKGVGSVQNAEIVSYKDTMRSKGFGFVLMQSVDEARRAVEVLHDQDFMGRKLVVSGAKTSDVRYADAEGDGESAGSQDAA